MLTNPETQEPESLLLITSSPKGFNPDRQGVLTAFTACGDPALRFAVSLGSGANSYSPSVDCRDGIIAVGRICGSILLIDAEKARTDWEKLASEETCTR